MLSPLLGEGCSLLQGRVVIVKAVRDSQSSHVQFRLP